MAVLIAKVLMKENIHPALHQIKIACSCGNVIDTLSTAEKIHVEVCSACHPFFTGKQKLLDTAGRIERFQNKYAKKDELLQKKKGPRVVTIN